MFILVLLCLLCVAGCALRLRMKNDNVLLSTLNMYKTLTIELSTHLKRLVELADEYELTEKGEISTMDFVTSITSFCRIMKNRIKKI